MSDHTRFTIAGTADQTLATSIVWQLLAETIAEAGQQGLSIEVVEVEQPWPPTRPRYRSRSHDRSR